MRVPALIIVQRGDFKRDVERKETLRRIESIESEERCKDYLFKEEYKKTPSPFKRY